MIIFPAIDIKDQRVVRLAQGHFDQVTEYAQDPVAVARTWQQAGAQWLHIIDLDGAKDGAVRNLDIAARVAREIDLPIQFGGGIRSVEDLDRLFTAGVSRAILGTRVIEDQDFLRAVLARWPERIAVSLDCADGLVAVSGWTQMTTLRVTDLARELAEAGLRYLIHTDIRRDGMLSGPNLPALRELLAAVKIPVIAAGGVSTIEDIRQLRALETDGLLGAITGKAIYEGTLDLAEAVKLCSQNG